MKTIKITLYLIILITGNILAYIQPQLHLSDINNKIYISGLIIFITSSILGITYTLLDNNKNKIETK